ncbi:nuclear envelope pore membrane protein POM 121-like [Carlito syrichta]|uniref:Nuclear envelope pore membrane protein POM 121-like n=1 Tax=Carlito syrichta TaxID=1868482 RepID=A0A3Q0DQP5_CARSF|nr:nuclear envelope pore membrane protein POM 121-like [Carlito syrichta]
MVYSSATMKITPPERKVAHSARPEQIISSTLSSPSSNAPDSCAKETVPSALKEEKKRTLEEEDQVFPDGQEKKRRHHESSGSGHSAFKPLVTNGVPTSFVPKPGSLKRGLNSQSSDDHTNKRSRTSTLSSLTSTYTAGIPISSHNAITSSYSSTRGISQSQLWKISDCSSSPFSSPASPSSQTPESPAKKIKAELCHHSSSPTPLAAEKESPGERVKDTAPQKKQNLGNCSSTPGSSGPRKRKVQLLPTRQGEPLTLPPHSLFGYPITAEEFDFEKKALSQRLDKVLEDMPDAASNSVTENPPTTQPSLTLTLPGFGATTQTTSSGSSSSAFGSITPSPFLFGGLATPVGSGVLGINMATPGTSFTSGAFGFGAGQSGTTSTIIPFGGCFGQFTLGTPSQSTPFAFNMAGMPVNNPLFGGTSILTFVQNTPAFVLGTLDSSLSSGASLTPAQGFVGIGPFRLTAPSSSTGAKSNTPGGRRRLVARRLLKCKK